MPTPAALLLLGLLGSPTDERPLALDGLDPVRLCLGEELRGLEDLTLAHGGFTYRFSSQGSYAAFQDEPERYAIQWDGGCGRMGPLSGKGDPSRFAVVDERIWIFASDGCRAGFLAAPERFLPPRAEPRAFTSSEQVDGRAWIEKAVAAHGGAAAIDRVRALTLRSTSSVQGWDHVHELVATSDGRVARRSIWDPPGDEPATESRQVVGEHPFAATDDGTYPLDSPDAIEDVRRYAHRQPLTLLLARSRDDCEIALAGTGGLADTASVDVVVRLDGLETMLHLDPESAKIVGLSWRGRAASGETRDLVERFTEWREVEGVHVPVDRRAWADGEELGSYLSYWDEVTLSPTVPADALRRDG